MDVTSRGFILDFNTDLKSAKSVQEKAEIQKDFQEELKKNTTLDREKVETLESLLKSVSFNKSEGGVTYENLLEKLDSSKIKSLSQEAVADMYRRNGLKGTEDRVRNLHNFIKMYMSSRNAVREEIVTNKFYQKKLYSNLVFGSNQMKKGQIRSAYGVIMKVMELTDLEGLDVFNDFFIKVSLKGRVHTTTRKKMLNRKIEWPKEQGCWGDESGVFRETPFETKAEKGSASNCYSNNGGTYTNDKITFELFEVADGKDNRLIGSQIVPLNKYADQRVFGNEIIRFQPDGPTLKYAVQWKHDTTVLFEAQAERGATESDRLKREGADLQHLFNQYDKPFSVFAQGATGVIRDTVSGKLAGEGVKVVLDKLGLTTAQSASQVVISIYLALVCIASFARAMYIDQGVSVFAFFVNLDARRWSLNKYKNCIWGLLTALCFDVWWTSFYLLKWGSSTAEIQFSQITRIFTVVNFIWRVILILFFWACIGDIKKREKQEFHMKQL